MSAEKLPGRRMFAAVLPGGLTQGDIILGVYGGKDEAVIVGGHEAKEVLVSFPEQLRADLRALIEQAVALGAVVRKPCEVCGNKRSYGHHDSYLPDDYLKVTWFCQSHHRAWHKLFLPEVPA